MIKLSSLLVCIVGKLKFSWLLNSVIFHIYGKETFVIHLLHVSMRIKENTTTTLWFSWHLLPLDVLKELKKVWWFILPSWGPMLSCRLERSLSECGMLYYHVWVDILYICHGLVINSIVSFLVVPFFLGIIFHWKSQGLNFVVDPLALHRGGNLRYMVVGH